ncbi:MAG: hypothetical protein AB7V16_11310 [Vulcanibacillus sp.]
MRIPFDEMTEIVCSATPKSNKIMIDTINNNYEIFGIDYISNSVLESNLIAALNAKRNHLKRI